MNMRPGDWSCPKCRDHQFARNHHCRECGTARPPRAGEWNCSNCGELQFRDRSACRSCGTSKDRALKDKAPGFGANVRKGDWICSSCGNIQFAYRTVCRDCNTSKPAPEDANMEDACLICAAKMKNASFLHGDSVHTVCCKECAEKVAKERGDCPVCRQPIESVLYNYT